MNPIARCIAPVLLVLCAAAQVQAQSPAQGQAWTERRFDPPPASRWTVQVLQESEDERPGVTHNLRVGSRADLTYETRTASGFRVSFVIRDIDVTGNAPAVQMIEPAFKALKDVVVYGTADASGKPVSVENVAEIQVAMRALVDGTVAGLAGEPRMQSMLRGLMTQMLIVDGERAARVYFSELPQLALGQNTGLRPGETRNWSEETPNPMGGAPMKANISLRIAAADEASGKVRYVMSRSADPEAVKAFGMAVMRQMGAAADKPLPPPLMQMMQTMELSIDSEIAIDVEGGMTRALSELTTTTASVAGQRFVKREKKTITVAPAR